MVEILADNVNARKTGLRMYTHTHLILVDTWIGIVSEGATSNTNSRFRPRHMVEYRICTNNSDYRTL